MAARRPDCPLLAPCPFFKTLALPASGETLKVLYCKGAYEACQRYLLKQAGREVPPEMWPDGTTAA